MMGSASEVKKKLNRGQMRTRSTKDSNRTGMRYIVSMPRIVTYGPWNTNKADDMKDLSVVG